MVCWYAGMLHSYRILIDEFVIWHLFQLFQLSGQREGQLTLAPQTTAFTENFINLLVQTTALATAELCSCGVIVDHQIRNWETTVRTKAASEISAGICYE